jgi:malate synthase
MSIGGFELDQHTTAIDLIDDEAAGFLAGLQHRFGGRRTQLLEARRDRLRRIDSGERLTFLAETESIRRHPWTVTAPPKDLEDRRVEITGSPEPTLMIDALNSGAKVFMADFEDACAPTWSNVLRGHAAIRDFNRGDLGTPLDGATIPIDEPATLVVGVRGWHQLESHVRVDGAAMSAALFDFGLCAFHSARAALDRGSGPYFSLPKMEGHLEARLWADVISHTEDALGLDRGSIRVTILIETILAAFEMDEILYELREHACGLNAGRSDYLFSLAKTFRSHPDHVLPDRSDIRMEVPFMRAFGELLVSTCHRRGVHAIGGVTAAIPDARDPAVTRHALDLVTADKRREAGDGFDGTLVAHPDTVPFAQAEFDRVLGDRPNQLEVQRDDVYITAGDLLAVRSTAGSITEAGVRGTIRIGVRYLSAWLTGSGSTAIDNVMIDTSAAEFSRAQLWQWLNHEVELSNGQTLTPALIEAMIDDECTAIRTEVGADGWGTGRFDDACRLFRELALCDEFADFLTVSAYDLLEPDLEPAGIPRSAA